MTGTVLKSTIPNMKIKDDKIIAKLPIDEKQELADFALVLDVPMSQIIREGVREKMVKLRKHPKVKAAAEAVEVA